MVVPKKQSRKAKDNKTYFFLQASTRQKCVDILCSGDLQNWTSHA